jgi:hypothetical protein
VWGSAVQGAAVHRLPDMRVGLGFDENYRATSGPIVQCREVTNWNLLESGETVTDLRAFPPTLVNRRPKLNHPAWWLVPVVSGMVSSAPVGPSPFGPPRFGPPRFDPRAIAFDTRSHPESRAK